VIDEAGCLPLDRADANRIFGVLNRRYTRGSTIVTSNKTVGEWADTFGDEALAAAILDRLLHDAEVLAINGPELQAQGPPRRPQAPGRRRRDGLNWPHRPTLFDADPPTVLGAS
jgi:DNA replication protein DnaC